MRVFVTIVAAIAVCAVAAPANAQLVRSASGATTGDITAARDQFRTDLGGGTVAGANGSFGGVRREINWDGVPDAFSAPNNLPANFFNVNSPRGVVFSTPGTGFQVSANAGVAPVDFGTIDPSYTSTFAPFSPQRLFTALGSNIVDINFFIPGTTTPALVTGFGAVFSDVDLAGSTSFSFFDINNVLLGSWGVPNFAGSETFSFLGVRYDTAIVSRVRITSGNSILAPGTLDGGANDLVVMDDFIFGEPVLAAAAAVPELSTWAMMLVGFAAIGVRFRRRRSDLITATA
jgi:hypothetical protein